MTVLQSLARYYDRMAARGEAEPPGYGQERIGFSIVLTAGGEAMDVTDLREFAGKRHVPRSIAVPRVGRAVGRTVAIASNLFWDKTAYALGRTAGPDRRAALAHADFKTMHADILAGETDEGLVALLLFLERWRPELLDAPPFSPEMLDANLVFRLDGDFVFLHERPAARRIVAARIGGGGPSRLCLVTGAMASLTRLHPQIRGVEGAQSGGASLVSFNLPAFESYGQEQGGNAPTSEAASFRYGEALNRMLARDSRNRVARPVGDATIVFWADTSASVNETAAAAAEDFFAAMFDPPRDDPETDAQEAVKLGDALRTIAEGRPEAVDPRLRPGTAFHVLGLAPNAGRVAVRTWLTGDFAVFAKNVAAWHEDLRIEPVPWRGRPPAIQRLLVETTALQEKFENIPPTLAGELSRAVLGGGRLPRTLLTAVIMRLRAGDDPATGWHAAAIRAVLARDCRLRLVREFPPMSLNRDNPDPAYQLGRLFATLEVAQRLALPGLNATIRDRYFGAASATPAGVFPLLVRGAQNHLGKLRKDGKGGWIEREIDEIFGHIGDAYPATLRLEAQGRFFIGYYHQRRARAARPLAAADAPDEETDPNDDE